MMAVGLLACWMGWQANRAESQRRAMILIRESGGSVFYEDEIDDSPDGDGFGGEVPGPGWLRDRVGEDYFRRVASVRFDAGFFHQTALYSAIRDEAIRSLTGLSDLTGLSFQYRTITGEQLRVVAGHPGLRSLCIENCRGFDGAGLKSLAHLSRLTALDIEASPIVDGDLTVIDGMSGLETLNLAFNPGITPAALIHLRGLDKLRSLAIDARMLSGPSLPEIRRLPRLTTLRLLNADSSLIDGSIRLEGLDSLERLEIHGAGSGEIGALSIELDLPGLTSLELIYLRLEGDAMPSLSACKKLEDATVWSTAIGDEGLSALSHVPSLRRLECYQVGATREGVDAAIDARPDLKGDLADYSAARPSSKSP